MNLSTLVCGFGGCSLLSGNQWISLIVSPHIFNLFPILAGFSSFVKTLHIMYQQTADHQNTKFLNFSFEAFSSLQSFFVFGATNARDEPWLHIIRGDITVVDFIHYFFSKLILLG